MTKDEMKDKISMALKDPLLQQGFEIICKNLAELEKENAELKKDKEGLDNTNNEQTRVILELQEHIIKVENDSNNCEHWSYTRIKQLEAQIERMKCCGNCKHREDCVYEHAWDLCEEWEFAE